MKGKNMNSTNPKNLRIEMKRYLDIARTDPIRILRRSGDSYVLINEKDFSEIKEELLQLQRKLLELSIK